MRLAETRWGSGRSKQLNPVVMGPGSRFACPARQLSLTIEFSNSRRHSRDMVCPSSAISLSLSVRKGRRESRALTAPAAPCAMRKENAHGLDRYSRDIPAFPAQWFYGFLRALPGERRFLSPLSAGYLPQNRRHGRGARTTRLRRTLLAFSPGSELPDASCVHRIPRPTFRDDRDPSPCWRGVS